MSATARTSSKLLSSSNFTPAQQAAIDFVYERDHSLLMVPMGFGKTAVALTAMNELIKENQFKRFLVFAPLRVCDLVWASESDKWSHLDASVAIATGDVGERIAAIRSNADITVVNLDNLPWFFKTYKAEVIAGLWDGLVVDELTKVKSVGGAWFKSLRNHIGMFKWRLGMTGTLAEEGLDKLYSMAMVVDGGKALGRRKDVFMEKYFTPTDYMRYNWEPKEGAREEIARKIKPFTFQHNEDDQDLPPLLVDYKYIDLPAKSRQIYEDLAKDMAIEFEDTEVLAVNAAVLSGKLQQICNGFVYPEEGPAEFVHAEKFNAVLAECDAHKAPVMVVYQYVEELEWLRHWLPNAGVLGNGCTKREALEVAELWNEGRLNYLLLHPASAGHGCNFQFGGNRIIFYGPIWSRDQTDQVIARLHRRGTPFDDVRVTFMVARDTVEDHVIVPRVIGKAEDAAKFREYLQAVGRTPARPEC